jgi:signal transduction histidine kinase
MEGHSGKIALVSASGKGSTFRLIFPSIKVGEKKESTAS